MERELAAQQAKKLGTDLVNVVREYWEVILLHGLFMSSFGKDMVFKGGTALRLVYGSPRFSEDLDFSLIRDSLKKEFCPLIEKIIKPFRQLTMTDCAEKHYTYLAEIKVSVPYLAMPFRIKIEVSKRRQKNYEHELKLINSPVFGIKVLAQVVTLSQLYKDKTACLKDRLKAKDIFDKWFLAQQMRKPYSSKRKSIPKKVLIRDLRKYLPKDFWPVIDDL